MLRPCSSWALDEHRLNEVKRDDLDGLIAAMQESPEACRVYRVSLFLSPGDKKTPVGPGPGNAIYRLAPYRLSIPVIRNGRAGMLSDIVARFKRVVG